MRRIVLFILGILLLGGLLLRSVKAINPIDDLQQQINELTQAREQSIAATKPLEGELGRLQAKLDSIEAGIAKAKNDLRSLEASILTRENDFAEQYVLLAERVVSFYKASRAPSSFFVLFTSGQSSNLARDLFYQEVVTDKDKDVITEISKELIQLERDKRKAEEDKVRLADLQVKVDKEAEFFRGEIAGAKAYQAGLSQQIAQLTVQQQQIIAQKFGTLNLPRTLAGGLYCTDDRQLNPDFSERPAFAFYTFGIPHYVGMNQYGAYGRAKNAGQNYKIILQAYYDNTNIECRDIPAEIDVQGYGRLPFEEYIKGVVNKEMGADIPEALKAQAIAARSYALNQSQPICTTQYCQVYSDARRGAVNDAVDATGKNVCGDGRAEVLVSGGQVITAWYASTFGGYAHRSSAQLPNADNTSYTKNFADTSGPVNSFSELHEKAYDKESKCFYAAQGWRGNSKSAWLSPSEVADIANVILLVRKDPSKACFVYQVDKSPPPPGKDCPETDNWSMEKVRQELGGGALTSVSSVEISGVDWGGGRTTQVTINGIPFDGNEFKNYFNVRAPANIQIVGPLYNVERR